MFLAGSLASLRVWLVVIPTHDHIVGPKELIAVVLAPFTGTTRHRRRGYASGDEDFGVLLALGHVHNATLGGSLHDGRQVVEDGGHAVEAALPGPVLKALL